MRSFVAINLPDYIKAIISHKLERVEETGLISGEFTKKENLVLILKFLGDIGERSAVDIEAALDDIEMESFEVKIGEVKFSPSKSHIKNISVEILGEGITQLQRAVEVGMEKCGFKRDDKKFSSELVLAKVKELKNKDIALKKIEELSIKKEKFVVDGIDLMKSEMKIGGPEYRSVCEFKF